MKQTYVAAAVALLVSLVPVIFVSQTVMALDVSVDQLQTATNEVAKTVTDDVTTTVNNGTSAATKAVNRATNNGNNGNHGQGNNGNNRNGRGNSIQNSDDSDSTIPENRFTANKLRVCEKQQDKIMNKISSISDRGDKQLEVFHSIAERVKAFYTAKGYHADSYDTVAQQVDTLYDQSLVALNTTQNSGETWSCNGINPTVQLDAFKQAKEAEMATLAAYKDMVHQLILTVKTAAIQAPAQAAGGNQ